jgi:hypothetical protein
MQNAFTLRGLIGPRQSFAVCKDERRIIELKADIERRQQKLAKIEAASAPIAPITENEENQETLSYTESEMSPAREVVMAGLNQFDLGHLSHHDIAEAVREELAQAGSGLETAKPSLRKMAGNQQGME